jgi:hypothetical protein
MIKEQVFIDTMLRNKTITEQVFIKCFDRTLFRVSLDRGVIDSHIMIGSD